MAAPTLDKPRHVLTCSSAKDIPSVEDLATSYRGWLEAYVNDAERNFGVYRPAGPGKWGIGFGGQHRRVGLLRRCFTRYALFPHTRIPSHPLPSDSEAILNDWAIVGTDLFAAMEKYKIIASHVADPESAERPASTGR
jgi:hypothetical protein